MGGDRFGDPVTPHRDNQFCVRHPYGVVDTRLARFREFIQIVESLRVVRIESCNEGGPSGFTFERSIVRGADAAVEVAESSVVTLVEIGRLASAKQSPSTKRIVLR